MTQKITRRGITVPVDYVADFFSQILVREMASYDPISLRTDQTLGEVRAWIVQGGPGSTHHGFPVVDPERRLVGLVSRRDLSNPAEPPTKRVGEVVRGPLVVVCEDTTLQEASELMAREGLGRIPVVKRDDPRKLVAILSGSDLRLGIRRRLQAASEAEQTIHWR